MKIRDIITETYSAFKGKNKDYGSTRSKVDASLANVVVNPEIRNTDTYMQYRYGLALAAAAGEQNTEFEQESPWAENISMVGYTEQDLEQIKRADKLMGVKSHRLTGKKSVEALDTNTVSTTASTDWKK